MSALRPRRISALRVKPSPFRYAYPTAATLEWHHHNYGIRGSLLDLGVNVESPLAVPADISERPKLSRLVAA